MSKIKLSNNFIKNTVKLALNEDLYPSGDITSNLIPNNKIIKFKLISNQNAIIGGLLFAKYCFALVDSKIKFIVKKKDGSFVKKNSYRFFFLKDNYPASLITSCKKLTIVVKFNSGDYIS